MRRRPMARMQDARSRAAFAAVREHERLGTDLRRRVEIFEIIEQQGIWLMFQPFKGLYGLYNRQGDIPGILINSYHPPSLQRFTAAHEYGHHVLGHKSSVDDAEQIQAMASTPEEAAAQAFAANFLMPLELVNYTLRRMGVSIQPPELTPRQVYRLSLEVGVSYTAAVTQLQSLNKINILAADLLRKHVPKQIKMEIGRGTGPADSRADIWTLDATDAGRRLFMRQNDELSVTLHEAASTGFIWIIEAPGVIDLRSRDAEGTRVRRAGQVSLFDDSVSGDPGSSPTAGASAGPEAALGLIADEVERPAQSGTGTVVGSGGARHLVFRVLYPGSHRLRLVKRRPWQRSAEPAEAFEVYLEVAAKPTGDSDSGLLERQKPLMAIMAIAA